MPPPEQTVQTPQPTIHHLQISFNPALAPPPLSPSLYDLFPPSYLTMPPTIEVLPPASNQKSSHITPGWAYVPDTGVDPAKAALQPSARKRGRDGAPVARADISARQQNAVLKRLVELDKENHKEGAAAQIAVPVRMRDGAGRGTFFHYAVCTVLRRELSFGSRSTGLWIAGWPLYEGKEILNQS